MDLDVLLNSLLQKYYFIIITSVTFILINGSFVKGPFI